MWFYIVWFRVDWTVQRPLMADQRFPLEKFSALYIDRNWNLSDEGRCFVSTQYCIFYYLSLSRIVNSSWPLLLDGLIDVHPISQENSFLTYLNAIPIQCRSAWLDHILTWSSPFFSPLWIFDSTTMRASHPSFSRGTASCRCVQCIGTPFFWGLWISNLWWVPRVFSVKFLDSESCSVKKRFNNPWVC